MDQNQASREWRWEIMRYSLESAPGIVSAVLGISRCEAADKLLEAGSDWEGKHGFREISSVAQVLGRRVQSTNLGIGRRIGKKSRIQVTDRFPTVGRWLRDHPACVAILRVNEKVLYVGYGNVLGNTPPTGRNRVTHAIFLD